MGSGLNLFNFFEDLGSPSPTVQPEAYTLTAHDVASHSFEHTDVAVREASWDGRVLRILYSVRDRTVDDVFTDDEIWTITICPVRVRMASRPIGAATICMSMASSCA
ncbi:MAG: hypothetical protein V8Q82_04760 [Christensenellales bacterium]